MASLRHIRTLLLAALLTLTTATLIAAPAHASANHIIPIAQARTLPLGSVVTVAGTVTTPSGSFESSFLDEGFGLQDLTAGIYVSLPTNLNANPGRQARVIGTLRDSYGLLILVPTADSDVTLGRVGPQVAPQLVATSAVGESTEGRLVRVAGEITQAPTSDLPYGYKFYVNDGSGEVQIYVNLQTGIKVTDLTLGQRVLVTGFSSQYGTHYEIDPRSPSDIRTCNCQSEQRLPLSSGTAVIGQSHSMK
jgi:DNA/RNA endonuclease YhcR with UshA esterase domain